MPHELPSLPYASDALEPYLDAQTMELHHGKHHAAYVKKLNEALEKHDTLRNLTIDELMLRAGSLPKEIRTAVRNNGGGHYNHSLFWKLMKKESECKPIGDVAEAIDDAFGSYQDFKKEFSKAAADRFGAGWAWLVVGGRRGKLVIESTPNQDNPMMKGNLPILGLDVWEHAYYLKYQNRRPEYIEAWWNVIDWEQVDALYRLAKTRPEESRPPAAARGDEEEQLPAM